MKLCIYFFNITILCIYVWLTHSLPQDFDDPTKFYKLMDFDPRHRGSFNITDCVRDLLNCWEIIKMDQVCSEEFIFDSVCSVIYTACDDNYGYSEWSYIALYEQFCPT